MSEPYSDPERPGCWRVPIASRIHHMEAIIDAESLPLVRGKRWNWSPGSGGRTNSGFVVQQGPLTPLARIIMGVRDQELLVSHVNGDKLDCRRENLIVRTRSEVALARKPSRKWEGLEPYADPDRPGVVCVPVCSDKHRGMVALIDASDLPFVQGKRWNWSPGRPDPAKDGSVVIAAGGTPRPSLTRIILGIDDPDQLVCHRNGDRLDCRRENLVVRTRSQVKAASPKVMVKGGRTCSSPFKGVQWNPDGCKWSTTIAQGGKIHQLGRFISEIDAALAYDAAAREFYGRHALLNFADPDEAERLRAEQPPVEPGVFPPPGMIDEDGACHMFNIPEATWSAWVQQGRMPLAGERVSTPEGGDCTLYRVEDLNRLQNEIRQLVKPYRDPDRSGCYLVPLISQMTYREAVIDAESLPLVDVRGWHWQARNDGSGQGQVVSTLQDGCYQPLARVVMEVAEAGFDTRVSHRNGDALDCRRSNIIVRSMQKQMFGNRKMGTVNGRKYTSEFKGVSWSKREEKWLAVIQRDRRSRRLGSFDSEIAAAQAYDEAARELFGEHARPNFPDAGERGFTANEQSLHLAA